MYKTINETTIQRLEDGAFIPLAPENSDYQEFLDWMSNGGVPEPAAPTGGGVPQEVSAAQAYAALIAANLYDDVAAWASDPNTDVLHRLAFEKATTFRRDSSALAAGSAALGWSVDMLDQLFIAAEKITL